jgi:hypothetical protein
VAVLFPLISLEASHLLVETVFNQPESKLNISFKNIFSNLACPCGPGSVVGIATGYGLDGPEIKFRWGQDFLHLSRPALGLNQPLVQLVQSLSRA